ncbi:MAG TPA: hypothetical protein VFJ77_10255 [Gaiellaceae bacterium]|nr:hypothetical protein [Gaiellaceae bacterium]
MKKLILPLVAVAALATAGSASAWHGHGHAHLLRFATVQHGLKLGLFAHAGMKGDWGARHARDDDQGDNDEDDQQTASTGGVFEKLTGTGSSLGLTTASSSGTTSGTPMASGTYAASVATAWANAVKNADGTTCAPATATITLTDSSSSANAVGATVSGWTCSVPDNSKDIADVFFGKADVSSATGTLSGVTGFGRVLLVQKTDGTETGFAFLGFHGFREHSLATFAARDFHHCGGDNG